MAPSGPARDRDVVHEPIGWHVTRWGDDPFSRGSWSYIRPGGSPADRWLLAEPIGSRLRLCGEAIGTDQPAMTHGAFDSGVRAATWAVKVAGPGEVVIVIGAGFAGIGAARALHDAGQPYVVLEGRDRIGGRAHTVDVHVEGAADGDTNAVTADAGAAWMQQFPKNPLARFAESLGVVLLPTDFHAPLAAAAVGSSGATADVGDVPAALDALTRSAAEMTSDDDRSFADVLDTMRAAGSIVDAAALARAVDADVVLETGGDVADTSARWFFAEDGVGNDDHIIRGGYRTVLDHLANGIDIRLDEPVRRIEHDSAGVRVTTDSGVVTGDRCICTVPISLLQRGEPSIVPPLPAAHRDALHRLGMGVVEKVILRFEHRWWPVPPGGYFRWYDEPSSWCEWVDLTDVCGSPAVATLIAYDAADRHHAGRSDREIAMAATAALRRWASAHR